MADRNERRGAPLSGDDLYGDRENLHRYRDFARDEHRRFAAQLEREESGGLQGRDALIDHDRVEQDFTRGQFRPGRRHATEGGYAYGNYSEVSPTGERFEFAPPREDRSERTQRGRGPRSYRRSDQSIYEDVCERLTEDDKIDASDIEVSVANGEVTLSGTVRSRTSKRRATQVADEARGVLDVHNTIRIVDEQVWPPR